MQVGTTAAFIEALGRSPLLAADHQAELVRLQSRFPDPCALAKDLVQRGWLTSFQVGQVLANRGADLILGPYLILERLGEGGAGQVFKARHRTMNRLVALKMVRKEQLSDPETIQRFRREIQLVSQLSHPNIVHALDAGPIGAHFVLVMEYVEGIDLERLARQSGPLPVAQACDYARQAALGLHHIFERGLVHRDIKPSNLLVAHTGGSQPASFGVLKILDLGLARLERPNRGQTMSGPITSGGAVLGTLNYLAPEQALDFRTADIRADIYGLGCTLYLLLAGKPPCPDGTAAQKLLWHQMKEPPPLEKARPEVGAALAGVVRRMMAKRPEDRYATPAEVAGQLAGAQALRGTVSDIQADTPTAVSMDVVRLPAVPVRRPVRQLLLCLLRWWWSWPWWRKLWVGGASVAALLVALLAVRFSSTTPQPTTPPSISQAATDFTKGWSPGTTEDGAAVTQQKEVVALATATADPSAAGISRALKIDGDFDLSVDFTSFTTEGTWRQGIGLRFDNRELTLMDTADGVWYLSGPTGLISFENPNKSSGRKDVVSTQKVTRRGETFTWSVSQEGVETVLGTKIFAGLGPVTSVSLNAWSHGTPHSARLGNFRLTRLQPAP